MASRPWMMRGLAAVVAVVAAVCVKFVWPGGPSEWEMAEDLDAEAVVEVCRAIATDLFKAGFWEDTPEKAKLISDGGILGVVKAMEEHSDDPEVQFHCVAVILTGVAGVASHQRIAAEQGALTAVLGAIRAHPHNATIVGRASQTLGALSDHQDPNSRSFGEMGASEVLMKALHDHDNNSAALFEIYCGLTGMTCHNIPENNQKLIEMGLVEVGLGHMRKFHSDHSIREEVQPVLSCLARSPPNEEYRQKLLDTGFLTEVVSAMRDFPEDKRLVSKSLESIRDLSEGRADVAAKLQESGTLDLMAEVMANFPPMKTGAVFWNVHQYGAHAAMVLARLGRENREALTKAGLHKQLKRSLDGDEKAERFACEALGLIANDGPEAKRMLSEEGVPARCLGEK